MRGRVMTEPKLKHFKNYLFAQWVCRNCLHPGTCRVLVPIEGCPHGCLYPDGKTKAKFELEEEP